MVFLYKHRAMFFVRYIVFCMGQACLTRDDARPDEACLVPTKFGAFGVDDGHDCVRWISKERDSDLCLSLSDNI